VELVGANTVYLISCMEYVQGKIDAFSLPVRKHYISYSAIKIRVLMIPFARYYDAIILLDCIEKHFHVAYHQFITTDLIHSLI